ncbi:MAG TPA: hypothetical protein VLS93_02215 [Anaeromyxobacteraceae bacterium]|nr:hypothetical protein [Anaeromyxobacteraceae bacterium]
MSVWRALATIILLGAASCGPPPDFSVRGTGVYVESDAPFARQGDLPARLESTIDAALRYWGGDWIDLRGTTITLVGAQYVPCGGQASSLGCYEHGEIRVSTRDPGIGTFQCVEQTVLVHEIGHAAIGDPQHTDPRWMDLEPVADELRGRTGYTESGEVECTIWVSVWRHPLGTR